MVSIGVRRLVADVDAFGKTFSATGAAFELGAGIVTRPDYEYLGGDMGFHLSVNWRFGGYGDFTSDDGAILISSLSGRAMTIEADGVVVRLGIGYNY